MGGTHEREGSTPSSRSNTMRSGSIKKGDEKEEKARNRRALEQSIRLRRQESDNRAAMTESEKQRALYGSANAVPTEAVQDLETLREDTPEGTMINFKARIHAVRSVSNKLAFFLLRHQCITVQGVLRADDHNVTRHMVRWAEHLHVESIVVVRGMVQAPSEKLRSASYHDVEVLIKAIHVISEPTVPLPFHHYGATTPASKTDGAMNGTASAGHSLEPSRTSVDSDTSSDSDSHASAAKEAASAASQNKVHANGGAKASSQDIDDHLMELEKRITSTPQTHVSLPVRMANRVLDLRAPSSQAIFRVQSGVCQAFRSFLSNKGFMEIHTPKLLGGASESGASVFKVDYFGRRACLAQSPQLFKQMCICADFGRVFEIGPVFRAENSNTHRHLTEYTGLDLEMELSGDDYHEAMFLIDDLIKSILKHLQTKLRSEIDIAKTMFPVDDFVWLDKTLILQYTDGIALLRDSGYVDEDGSVPSDDEDLSTRAEIRLGGLVREKYHTDYYILDKFPRSVRPFYTHPDDKNVKASNSFDVFLRGQEIISGGQRIHNAEQLEANINKQHIDSHGLEDYLESFRLGAPQHAGCGIGLERFVMLFLGLNDIRNASLFPRDPRSLRGTTMSHDELRFPEASTMLNVRKKEDSLQPLEKLIANYGDSCNTSWLDDRYEVWRELATGAAVGYSRVSHDRAVVIGNPLCEVSQYQRVATLFLAEMKKQNLKTVWLLVGSEFESVLTQGFNWKSLSCTVESRVKGDASDAEKKARNSSKKADFKLAYIDFNDKVPDERKKEAEERIRDWLDSRKDKASKQVHMTDVAPWQDEEHRAFFLAYDHEKRLCAMVVLAPLSPRNGYQIKWSLDFPGSPSGAIEFCIVSALQQFPSANFTFGGAAATDLIPGSNIRGVKARALESTYHTIAANLHLLNKTEFRKKFGASVDERLWICYPSGGMSPRAIKGIVGFFTQDAKSTV